MDRYTENIFNEYIDSKKQKNKILHTKIQLSLISFFSNFFYFFVYIIVFTASNISEISIN